MKREGANMRKLPVLPKKVDGSRAGRPCVPDASLPVFYMVDYSVLGLLVDRFQEAVRVLEREFTVVDEPVGVGVVIDGAAHVQKVFQVLEKHHIACEMADIVDQIYQG